MGARFVAVGAIVPAWAWPWVNAALAVVVAAMAAAGGRRLRGTTLAAPAWWAVVAALTAGGVESFIALRPGLADELAGSLLRYAAAAGAFCPLVAVLGAKRPQDRGWQWVVAALWVTLLVPAGQALAASSSARLELAAAWRWLAYGLAAMGLLNYLPTRYAVAGLLTAAGQICLLGPYGAFSYAPPERQIALGLGLFVLASATVLVMSRRARRATYADDGLGALEARWLRFRDGWGAFWGLRILQRVNQTAQLAGWPVRLAWHGFVGAPGGGQATHGTLEAGEQPPVAIGATMDTLLRRFEAARGFGRK